MSSVEIDPTFVLKYLNDLGYRNISAAQLKEFIRDLKKLIKYDKSNKENEEKYYQFMKETACSQAKRSNLTHAQPRTSTAKYDHPGQIDVESNEQSKRTTTHSSDCMPKKSKSTISQTTRTNESSYTNRTSDETTTSRGCERKSRARVSNSKEVMWIRPKSETRTKKCDPVTLYQSYQNDWNRFKQQIPIDNKHQDLRWNIRKKIMG